MAFLSNGGGSKPTGMSQWLARIFQRPAAAAAVEPWGDRVLPPEERKAAMDVLDPTEIKLSKIGLGLITILAPAVGIWDAVNHAHRTVTVHGHKTLVPLQASWLILAGVILAFCVVGFIALYRRKRTLVVFTLFIIGLATIPLFAPLGFALVVLAGWVMMRAYRINKYGTPVTKVVAREAAKLPPRRERKRAAAVPPKPTGYSPPKANKRYTPKAAPRKKVTKPVE
jgi:hypothetical protein